MPILTTPGCGIDIVEDGKAKAVIVTPKEAFPVVQYAAGELVNHIELASGVRLKVLREGEAIPEGVGRIYVGQTEAITSQKAALEGLKNNGFFIINNEAGLFLAGEDGGGVLPFDDDKAMGTLFAVYQWLEEQLGVRWLWPGELGTIVPKKSVIIDRTPRESLIESRFIHTRLRYGNEVYDQWRDVMSKQDWEKFLYDTAVWLRRHRFARPVSFSYGHGYNEYWKRFGEKHPDWFALRTDGVRGPIDNQVHLVQMCVSNAGLQDQVVQDWLARRKSTPGLPWINGIENDKRVQDPACQCVVCKSWDSANSEVLTNLDPFLLDAQANTPQGKGPDVETSLSDRYAKYWLALQKKGEKYDPQATVVGYAYSETALPPLETKLNERVVVGVVPPFVYPHTGGKEAFFQDTWKRWADTGASLMLRPNYFLMGGGMPYIFATQFGNDFKFAMRHGMIGTDFDSLTSMWAVQGPNLYMLGRLHSDPQITVNGVLDEYYKAFGKGEDFVRQYFEMWERITTEKASNERLRAIKDYPWSGFCLEVGNFYSKENLDAAEALLDKALEAVSDDDLSKRRVEFLKKGLIHTALSLDMIESFKKYRDAPGNELLNELKRKIEIVNRYRQSLIGENVVNLAYLNFVERRAGIGKLQVERTAGRQVMAVMPLFWDARRDTDNGALKEEWLTAGSLSEEWLRVRTDRPLDRQAVGKKWLDLANAKEAKVAWYRAEFSTPEKIASRGLYLGFEGLSGVIEVWVNGKQIKVANSSDGDATPKVGDYVVQVPHVHPAGQKNTVLVRLKESGACWTGIEHPVRILADF